MVSNFSAEIMTILDDLGRRFGVLIDWTNENIFPYVQNLGERIVQYELYSSIAWIVIDMICIILTICVIKKHKVLYDILDEIYPVMVLILVIGSAVSLASIGIQIFDIIKCLTIPEVVWFDYFKDLMNKQ